MDGNETGSCAQDPLDQIRSLYPELALRPDQEFGWGKGKSNAKAAGLFQIEFREADMIHLGLPDAVADVVISKCPGEI